MAGASRHARHRRAHGQARVDFVKLLEELLWQFGAEPTSPGVERNVLAER